MKLTASIAMIAAGALAAAAISTGQEVRPVPGPGTGVVNVRGTVDIAHPVSVQQASEWRVGLAGVPDVRVSARAPLEFVRIRGSYEVTWVPGQVEKVVVVQLGPAGWTRVETGSGRRRWINLDAAQSVEELDGGR